MCAEFECMWDCFTGFKGEQTSGWGTASTGGTFTQYSCAAVCSAWDSHPTYHQNTAPHAGEGCSARRRVATSLKVGRSDGA